MGYPLLEIDLAKVRRNVEEVVARCRAHGVSVAGVVKGYSGLPELSRMLEEGGCAQLASARLSQLAAARRAGLRGPFMLIRIPMPSELAQVVELCRYSLHSERAVLDALEAECARQGREHSVILMAELGDLREGVWGREALEGLCLHVERELPHLRLAGVGANLGCYGSIRCTTEKMEELVSLAEGVERSLGRRLELISGGATNAYVLMERGGLPARINHLRIGGGMVLGRDMAENYGDPFDYIAKDAFTLKAQVVEVGRKPSHPVGEIFRDSFGEGARYEDRGERLRALAAAGKVDYYSPAKIIPRLPGVQVLGASSDHTILDVEDCPVPVRAGDILEFDLRYPAMAFLTAGRDVEIRYV